MTRSWAERRLESLHHNLAPTLRLGRLGRLLDELDGFPCRLRPGARLAAEAKVGKSNDGLTQGLFPADADFVEIGVIRSETTVARHVKLIG
jgi:hypothetical protein